MLPITRYFAFVPDLATIFFLLFHEIKFSPIKTQKPKLGLLLFTLPAQSAFEYPTILVLLKSERRWRIHHLEFSRVERESKREILSLNLNDNSITN